MVDQVKRSNGQLEISLDYGEKVVKWQIFLGDIYIFNNDNSIYLWNIEYDLKTLLI